MPYKVLLTQHADALGQAIQLGFDQSGFMELMLLPQHLNWGDETAVSRWLDAAKPDAIINTCGWSDDGRDASFQAIVEPAKVLATLCSERQWPLLQLSSYRVFNGEKSGFVEADELEPRDEVGELYRQAEQVVAEAPQHLILRLSWVIGWQGQNLLTRIMLPLLEGAQAEIVSERRGSPVSHEDIARVVNALAKQISCGSDNWGVFHYGAADICTEDEFAVYLVKRLGDKAEVLGEVMDVSGKSTEPLSAALGYRHLMDCFGVQPRTWKQAVNNELALWANNNPMAVDQA
ncbi:sugar nucleotide-binding protein [Halioxenophilus aromaticivorans]|uniref:dTDP-4-dehydrorhamnose reductase n=1 Tax=Halioxenophilus aromaticivorans TaxID=1306992 RepID=A0AAV3U7W2_9ALTE